MTITGYPLCMYDGLCFLCSQPGVPAFTVPQHPEAMRVLKERAIEIGVGSYVTLFKAVETFILKQLDVPVINRHIINNLTNSKTTC